MFKTEFLSLIKEYHNSSGEEKKKILNSMLKLANDHPEEYEELRTQGIVTDQIEQDLIETSKNQEAEEEKKQTQPYDEVSRIKNVFLQWVNEYNPDAPTTPNMNKLVEDIVKFYAPNRFGVLQRILSINDSPEFEAFKNHLKNNIRAYYAQKILDYTNSQKYKDLKFLKKMRKDKELKKILDDINSYEFDPEKIREVLQ